METEQVMQVAFNVPSWVQEGVKTGSFKIFGGVVRNPKGEIVYHLKDVALVADKRNVKTKIIVVGVVVVGTAVVISAAYAVNKVMKKKNEVPNAFNHFNQKFIEYILAAKDLNLDTHVINNLDESIDLLKLAIQSSKSKYTLEEKIDSSQFDELIDSVYKYTLDLLERNMIQNQHIDRCNQGKVESNLIDLQKYLFVQRNVFLKSV